MAFPTKKNSVLDDFPLCLQGPPPSKTRNSIFIVSPSLKIDRAHFRVHSREHCKISRQHSRGSLRGDPLVRFTQKKKLNLRGHFRGHLRVHSRGHFREHFRERVRGSNFAVRMLCAFLIFLAFFPSLPRIFGLCEYNKSLFWGCSSWFF